jgi:phenylalanyl-tRNA synthetase alpha chain
MADSHPSTTLVYLADAYLQTGTAKILEITTDGKVKPDGSQSASLILDQTLFYAQGGGQPADQGTITSPTGTFTVTHVSYNGGAVLHKGSLTGTLEVGQEVTLQLDWQRRYQHMQWHTAGHIVDQAVKTVLPGAKSIDGNHGIGKKLSITWSTPISTEKLSAIQTEVNNIVAEAAAIYTEMVSKDEIIKRGIQLPFDLPTNKPLRLLQIGNYSPMPDGGTHLKTTAEVWPITVTDIIIDGEKTLTVYTVQALVPSETPNKPPMKKNTTSSSENTLSLSQLKRQADDLKAELSLDQATADQLQTKYLGKKGAFNQLAQALRNLAPEDRKNAGQVLNELKTTLEKQIAKQTANEEDISGQWTDLTAPGKLPQLGHMHPVSQAMEEITQIFERIGFTRVRYPEVDWDYYVFEALNMPSNHPARDEWETFFIDAPIDKKFGKVVLTTHTSNGQVREMERLNSTPPIRMINIARCYRRQQDATHTQMFHQFEGLVVDKGITIQHLKGTLDYFAQQFYGPGTKSRIRPFHFQFTEPSFEVDFSCHICGGTGVVTASIPNGVGTAQKCKFCKSGWHEVGGAGMVHPNVLKYGGIDPDVYTGFAFGWGIERTYTLKPGLNIDDIRLLYSGEMRFLEQF